MLSISVYPCTTFPPIELNMNRTTPELREMAARLLEADADNGEVSYCPPAVCFCGQFSIVLSKLTGPAGALSLLTRALVLARHETPCLSTVQVKPDGWLQGFPDSAVENEQEEWRSAGIVLVAQLLGLLHAFIGEQLTLQMVDEAWPCLKPNTQVDRKSES